MNQTTQDILDLVTPLNQCQRESAQQLPAATTTRPQAEALSPSALLQLEAEVYSISKAGMTLTVKGAIYPCDVLRLPTVEVAKLGDRYVVILSPVQCGEIGEP